MKLQWVKQQLKEKLGFVPYPGTLDVKIADSVKLKALAEAHGIQILPAPSFSNGKCFRASFKTERNCAVVIPEIAGYPEDLIEVVAPENLRKKFHLSDGDLIEFEIML
jgi:riboflavin kinase